MKNDESTTDLVLYKKLTALQKLTGLCDYIEQHTTRYYIEQQKVSEVFLFLVQTNMFCDNSKKNCKGLASQGNFVVSVLPRSSRVAD